LVAGPFYNPTGVAVDATGNVYVVDSCNNRIQKFVLNKKYYNIIVTATGIDGGTIKESGGRINAIWNGSALTGTGTSLVPTGSGPYTITATAKTGSKVSWTDNCDTVAGNGTSLATCTIKASIYDKSITAAYSIIDSIAGKVVADDTGLPLEHIHVHACPRSAGLCGSASTDASGDYKISGLLSGPYAVYTDATSAYAREYYNNVDRDYLATEVNVASGATTTGIDFSLAPIGSIAGKVIAAETGLPISGIWVHACPMSSALCHATVTNATGNYSISRISTGLYKVYAGGNGFYASGYYNNALNINDAAAVTVLNGKTTTGIDFSLALVAPHIQVSSVLLLEDFSSGMPASWTVSGAWTTDNTTCPKTLATPFVAPWAVADSACTSTNVEYLTTGAFSAKNCTTAELAFTSRSVWNSGNGKVDVSADGGATWRTKLTLNTDEGPLWKAQVMDELAGSSNSMVRFIYNNNTNLGYWAIDNIWVMCRPAALNFTANNQQKALVIENTGTADLNIGAMNLTGANNADFSINGDDCSNKALKPADICGAKITFSTTATGLRNAVLNIPSNDAVVSNTTFVLQGMTTAVGDSDNSGTMNIVDALFVARHAAGLSVSSFISDAADVNCDGAVNIVDALFIARKAAGLNVTGWCGN